jgi:hypothetical protein
MGANSITDVHSAAREIALAAGVREAEVRAVHVAPKPPVMPRIDKRQLSAVARTP